MWKPSYEFETRTVEIESNGVKLRVLRPRHRVVWLDTSVFLHLFRLHAGKAEPKSVGTLDSVLRKALAAQECVVVEGEQESEVLGDWSAFRDLMLQYTLDRCIKHPLTIEERQIGTLMAAWVQGSADVEFPLAMAYRREVYDLEGGSGDFIIRIVSGTELDSRRSGLETSERVSDQVEPMRLAARQAGESFEERLEAERGGFLRGLLALHAEGKRRIAAGDFGFDAVSKVTYWNKLNIVLDGMEREFGSVPGGIQEFLVSAHGRAVPALDIAATIWADLATGQEIVVRSDVADIEHLKTVMPFCDVLMTDKRMAARIRRRGLDKKYCCQVLKLSESEALAAALDAS